MNTVATVMADLESLAPKERVEFLLILSEGLRRDVDQHRHASRQTEEVFSAFDLAMERTRLWLQGQLSDADALRYPGYNDDGTDIADTTLEYRELLPDADIEIVGNTITNTVLYAAFLQYQRDGVKRLPHPFDGDLTVGNLAEYLVNYDRANYSPKMRAKFDRLWEAKFRPAG